MISSFSQLLSDDNDSKSAEVDLEGLYTNVHDVDVTNIHIVYTISVQLVFHQCTLVAMCVCVCVHVCVFVCVYMYVCMCVCVCNFTTTTIITLVQVHR